MTLQELKEVKRETLEALGRIDGDIQIGEITLEMTKKDQLPPEIQTMVDTTVRVLANMRTRKSMLEVLLTTLKEEIKAKEQAEVTLTAEKLENGEAL